MNLDTLKPLEASCKKRKIPILHRERGTWLHKQIQQIKPTQVLELGGAVGYSGIILGSAGAEVVSIEKDQERGEEAKKNFKKFGVKGYVIIKDAVEEVKTLAAFKQNHGSFDFIFIDIDPKSLYLVLLEYCLKLLRKDGHLVADNITFKGCQDFKETVLKHPQLETEIVLIDEDGFSISKKIK